MNKYLRFDLTLLAICVAILGLIAIDYNHKKSDMYSDKAMANLNRHNEICVDEVPYIVFSSNGGTIKRQQNGEIAACSNSSESIKDAMKFGRYYGKSCIDGVSYLSFYRFSTVQYKRDGEPTSCED